MILSDRDLKDLIKSKQLKIEPFDNAINPTSIDLRLGSILVKYLDQIIKLDTIPESKEIDITNDGYVLQPGEFVLGMTVISSIFWPCLRSISWPQVRVEDKFGRRWPMFLPIYHGQTSGSPPHLVQDELFSQTTDAYM